MLDITTLAAWGEFLGGIAVVISLVYLASQIRQNSKLLRASTTSSTNEQVRTLNTLLAQEPELATIFWNGNGDRDALSENDRQRFDNLMSLQFQTFRQQYQFERYGIGTSEEWQYIEAVMRWQVQQPGAQRWWQEWGGMYPEAFYEFTEGLIRRGEAAG